MKTPIRVAVTGAAGQIGYALLFRIARGEMLGKDQPVILQLVEIPQGMSALQGTVMELHDCAFPLLHSIECSDDPMVGFRDAQYIILVGARPRSKDMTRADLLKVNGAIFSAQGRAISEVAPNAKVLVVGNPANTNALILMHNSPKLKRENLSAMMRLDHNRAIALLAEKTEKLARDVQHMVVWGNHSDTMFPDLQKTTIAGQSAWSVLTEKNRSWYSDTYLPSVAKRGTAIIQARGASSAASAASAAIDHIRDWHLGTEQQWVTMAIPTDGKHYGIPEGLICGMPCTCQNGTYSIVSGLHVDTEEYQKRFSAFITELTQERDAVKALFS